MHRMPLSLIHSASLSNNLTPTLPPSQQYALWFALNPPRAASASLSALSSFLSSVPQSIGLSLQCLWTVETALERHSGNKLGDATVIIAVVIGHMLRPLFGTIRARRQHQPNTISAQHICAAVDTITEGRWD